MSERGIKLNVEAIRNESSRIAGQLEGLQHALDITVGREVNPDSPKQLQALFYDELGFKPYINRKTGTPTTDEDALKRLARKGASPAEIILKMRSLSKLKGTYLDAEVDSDNRIRCSYNPVGTSSGRLSSSKTIWGTGINMQTDPPEFRRYLLFDDGYAGYNIDLSQAENRIVAYTAPEPAMIEAFESKIDVHTRTASLIFEVAEDQVTRRAGECPICTNPDTCGHEGMRFWGKKANHGLNYGLGYKTFALYYDIPEYRAQKIVLRYHQAYPGVSKYQQDIIAQLGKNRTIENLMSRRRVYRDRWGEALFKEAYSFIPQSTVADVIDERGLIYIYYNRDLLLPVELLAQRHDSIAFQIPLTIPWSKHAEILLAIRSSLETPLKARGREFVIPADMKMGQNMYTWDEKNPFPGAMRSVKWSDVYTLARQLEETWNKVKGE
jgi:DNA polymerase-1